MTRILVFGGDSLVGSHFLETTTHRVTAIGRRDPRASGLPIEEFKELDLGDLSRLDDAVQRTKSEVVVNFAAATDVDAVERERPGPHAAPRGPAFRINAEAPGAMAQAARASGKFLISVSTDFVFDGLRGPYSETADPAPLSSLVSWYGWTKGEGERRIRSTDPSASIVRIAYPYRAAYSGKLDFARRIVEARRRGALPAYFDDQQITPTWIPDVSRALEHLIKTRPSGTFHVASPEVTTPFRFAQELMNGIGGAPVQLTVGSMAEFLRKPGVTPRPLRGGLSCQRIQNLGLPLTAWQDGIRHFVAEGGGR
jgi:dTDP-4-dehydrorhamnose reductase